uniref:Uncharacterized protein n=1 Tax=Rhizophora mucronata TaxID=61149 RepID=A0A2P2QSQ1_RHIMU
MYTKQISPCSPIHLPLQQNPRSINQGLAPFHGTSFILSLSLTQHRCAIERQHLQVHPSTHPTEPSRTPIHRHPPPPSPPQERNFLQFPTPQR